MYRIACVSRRFPPEVDAEGMVSRKWVDALRAVGCHVDVFCTSTSEEMGRAVLEQLRLPSAPGLRWALGAMGALRQGLADPREDWLAARFAWAAAGEIKRRGRSMPYDAIVARYEPLENVVAGVSAARALRQPLIASFNDPMPRVSEVRGWPEGGVDRLRNAWNRRAGARAVDQAAALVFPTEPLRQLCAERLSGRDRRVGHRVLALGRTIPHIGGGPEGSGDCKDGREEARTFVIRHVGSVSRRRPVDDVLRAAELLRTSRRNTRLQIEFVGEWQAEEARRVVEDASQAGDVEIRVRGAVPWREAWREICSAGALLLIEEPTGGGVHLPSKFCDYAVARRPIVAITHPESVVAKYLAADGGGRAIAHGKPEELASALEAAAAGEFSGSERLAGRFSAEAVAAAWCDLFRQTVEGSRRAAAPLERDQRARMRGEERNGRSWDLEAQERPLSDAILGSRNPRERR